MTMLGASDPHWTDRFIACGPQGTNRWVVYSPFAGQEIGEFDTHEEARQFVIEYARSFDFSTKTHKSAVIQTYMDYMFDVAQPAKSSICILDIAHGLSNICRFGGHTKQFYSVAQHSVLVSRLVPHNLTLAALLHDAAEAYLGDVPTPIKRLLPDYQALYSEVERAIENTFKVKFDLPEIKSADIKALVTEKRDLIGGKAWAHYDHIAPCQAPIAPLAPEDAKTLFINRFLEVTNASEL